MVSKKTSARAPSDEIPSIVLKNARRGAVPDDLKNHPLIHGQVFYTLPSSFWKSLFKKLDKARFDSEVVVIELQLATCSDSIGACVGFRNGLPLTDELLRPINQLSNSNRTTEEYFQSRGWTTGQIRNFCKEADRRVELLTESRRGYLGWLFTNRNFLEEFDALKHACPEITSAGKPVPLAFALPIGESAIPQQLRPVEKPDPSVTALQNFYERWRLQSITGPRTIQPIGIQSPVMLPGRSSAQSQSSGALLYIPDIAPLPDRDELRLMLENSIRGSGDAPPHLTEWIELVRADTKGKKSIQKYARWFRIQHVLRVLYSRHANSLIRCNRKMEEVLIECLSIKPDTIHHDLIALRRRLSKNWFSA